MTSRRCAALAALIFSMAVRVPASAAPLAGRGVRIWLRLPENPSPDFVGGKLAGAEKTINSLISFQTERVLATSNATGRSALRIGAPGWRVGAAGREPLIAALKDAWGSDLVIEEPQSGAPAVWPWVPAAPFSQALRNTSRSVDMKSVGKMLGANVPAVLAGLGGGIFFDGGGSIWRGGDFTITETPTKVTKASEEENPKKDEGLKVREVPVPGVKPESGTKRAFFVGLPFENLIQKEAADAGVDPAVIRAIVQAKSGYDPSKAAGGGFGLMMVSHGAAETVGVGGGDLNDPATNLRAGSRYMAWLLKRFDGDLHRALAAYHVGPTMVQKSGGIPNHRGVKLFLENFEKAYQRPPSQVKPVPTVTPARAALNEARLSVVGAIQGDPKDPVKQWRPLIDKYAKKHGVDADLVEAVLRQENPWGDPKRKSSAGAVGLMQIMPATGGDYGLTAKDLTDPEKNIEAGVKHLKMVLDYLDGDLVLAVAGYNSGHGRVKKLGRVPNLRETVKYVTRVFDNYEDLTGKRVDIQRHMTAWAKRYSDAVA